MADGNEAPHEVRRVLLDVGGEWDLVRGELPQSGTVALARALVDLGLFSATEAVRAAKSPTAVLATGTQVEVKCLALMLASRNVAVYARRRVQRPDGTRE